MLEIIFKFFVTALVLLAVILLSVLAIRSFANEKRRVKDAARYGQDTGDEIATTAKWSRNDMSGSRCGSGSACTGGVMTPPYSGVGQDAVSKLDTAYAGLDLSGAPRATYRLTLRDGQILHLRTPSKAVADSFARVGEVLQRLARGRQSSTDVQELYVLASKILSHNTAAMQIDARQAMEDLTLAELTELLTDYMAWLTEVIESKN